MAVRGVLGTLISFRRTRGWGYESGVGSMSELPAVAVVIVLGAYILLIQSVHSLMMGTVPAPANRVFSSQLLV